MTTAPFNKDTAAFRISNYSYTVVTTGYMFSVFSGKLHFIAHTVCYGDYSSAEYFI